MTFVQWLDRLFRRLIYPTTVFYDTDKYTDQTRSYRNTDTTTTTTTATANTTSTITAMYHHHHHHRPSSPLFDISDFPSVSRRIKPLPKRRRTINTEVNANVNINKNQIDDDDDDGVKINSGINSIQSTMNSNSMYPAQSSISSRNVTHISDDVVSPIIDVQQRSQYNWSDLFLSEEILRVASALPSRGSVPGIGDDGSVGPGGIGIDDSNGAGGIDDGDGSGDGDTEESFLLPERKTISSETLSTAATPPPPSDTSSYDGDSPQLPQTTYRPSSFYRSARQFIRERLNLDEPFDPEFTEGELQDRFFLRAETDRLIAQTDSLSARMALRSYYHSMGYSTSGVGTSTGASLVPLDPVLSSGVDRSVTEYVSSTPLDGNVDGSGTTVIQSVVPGNGYVGVGVGRAHDEEGRGGDYTDHLNYGNTKKRKVPANVGGSPPHHHHYHHHYHHYHHHHYHHYALHRSMSYGEIADGIENGEKELNFGSGFGLELGTEAAVEDSSSGTTLSSVQSDIFGPHTEAPLEMEPGRSGTLILPAAARQWHRTPKLSRATVAGLYRKEVVRSRKKRLEAIMGDLPASDSLVLEQALSRTFPLDSTFSTPDMSPLESPIMDLDHGYSRGGPTFVRTGGKRGDIGSRWNEGDEKVRLSRREGMRAARAARTGGGRLGRHPDAAPFPTGDFTYFVASACE